ncbi:cation transporter [Oscillatoria sp. FACHB-1406]|uniref:cation transporter n=1 Tax=Oscillatoria sp. FACHB-1406 TaxID=2692846 RepID=UPI001684336F|nr:cation transporter [Oscillatoria sp. FACHB-1406]MBD2576097.1 cation transporter [Oscillatoria sp. FACHB-1406]
MTDRQDRYFISRSVLWATLWLTILLLGAKVWMGWEFQSLALLAQSLHSEIATFSLLFSWLAVTSPDRPTGEEIYGHGKRETFLVLLFAVSFAVAWLGLAFFCLQQLAAIWNQAPLPFPVRANLPMLQFLGLFLVATLALALLDRIQARICRYPMLRFNAEQLFKDAGLMLLTLASAIGVWWGEPLFDSIAAAILLVLALEGFWRVLIWHFPLLVEQTAIAPEVLERTILKIDGVIKCYNIKSRGLIGRFVYISISLVLESGDRQLAPKVARKIEQVLRERYGPIQITCTIETDPDLNRQPSPSKKSRISANGEREAANSEQRTVK